MQPDKRSWLYGGLAHPPSVVIARVRAPVPVRTRLPPGSRLLVAGDDHAWGLVPFLRQLCRDTRVKCDEELDHDGNVGEWARTHRLLGAVQRSRPHMVLLSLGTKGEPLAPAIATVASEARAHGATLVWLRPPLVGDESKAFRALLDAQKIPSFHSEALELPRGPDGQPTVRGYAGWAGALWRWIG